MESYEKVYALDQWWGVGGGWVTGGVRVCQNHTNNWESLSDRHLSIVFFTSTKFKDIKCRTNRYSYSLFPDATKSWNTFISQLEYFPTYGTLKKYMISGHRPGGKSVFDIHYPMGLRHLFQLRLGLSSLGSDKDRYGFVGTPTCLSVQDWSRRYNACFTSVSLLQQ